MKLLKLEKKCLKLHMEAVEMERELVPNQKKRNDIKKRAMPASFFFFFDQWSSFFSARSHIKFRSRARAQEPNFLEL